MKKERKKEKKGKREKVGIERRGKGMYNGATDTGYPSTLSDRPAESLNSPPPPPIVMLIPFIRRL